MKVRISIGLLLGAVALVACSRVTDQSSAGRPNVLLVTIDTLRADRLGCYGSGRTRTPNIDRLAQEGSLFENAATPMPITRPSHVSMLTSLYPRDHGVINNAVPLAEGIATLPEELHQAGYQTAGFVGVRLLAPDAGVNRGFDTFDFPDEARQRPADEVVPLATKWLENRSNGAPFFIWLHLFDPHMPYAPPPPFNQNSSPALVEEIPDFSWPKLYAIVDETGGDLPGEAFERALDLYDGEVEYVDHWIGVVIGALENEGVLEDTIIVFTADHGECFGRGGVYFEHSSCLYDGAVTVPLIVRYPEAIRVGSRISYQVDTLDIAPTILGLLEMDHPEAFLGRSLVPLVSGEPTHRERYAYLEHAVYTNDVIERRRERYARFKSVAGMPTTPVRTDDLVGVRTTRWKYLLARDEEELYDLRQDPDELRNVADTRRETVQKLKPVLRRWLKAHPLKIKEPETISPDLMETLKSLGYH